jgi:L,D-transpeptidase ErfK/SrfK
MVINILLNSKIGFAYRGRLFDRFIWGSIHYVMWLSICICLLHGCFPKKDDPATRPLGQRWVDKIEKNHFSLDRENDIIGRLAVMKVEWGDTLPDIARHFSLGINAISAANPGVDVWVPSTDEHIVLPLSFILPDADRKGIVINLAAMRLFQFQLDGNLRTVSTYPVGVGTAERPTPRGQMYITRKQLRPTWYVPASIAADYRKKGDPLPAMVPPGPLNPLGEHALYLNKSTYLVHGTNKPSSIGLRATNGCIRLYPEDIKRLFNATAVKTPVTVVNQPYLSGLRDGIIYLEAHTPFDESGTTQLKEAYEKLKKIGKKTSQVINWSKVKKVVSEARGIPIAVSAKGLAGDFSVPEKTRLRHPDKLYGQPRVPEFRTDAWYVLAASLHDTVEAQRLAAIINHQGPQIPARVLSERGIHRVLAGPFGSKGEAKNAAKRIRIDLEIEDALIVTVQHK